MTGTSALKWPYSPPLRISLRARPSHVMPGAAVWPTWFQSNRSNIEMLLPPVRGVLCAASPPLAERKPAAMLALCCCPRCSEQAVVTHCHRVYRWLAAGYQGELSWLVRQASSFSGNMEPRRTGRGGCRTARRGWRSIDRSMSAAGPVPVQRMGAVE